MANPQIYPLEVNPRTGEPFLRLKNHKNIIITPPRQDDVALYPAIMNDPRIYEWLGNPPFPYTTEHAEAWYAKVKALSDGTLKELEAAKESPDLILVGDCPVRAIREVKGDGEDTFIGDIGIMRSADGKLMAPAGADDERKAKYVEENAARKLGDPKITWTVGGVFCCDNALDERCKHCCGNGQSQGWVSAISSPLRLKGTRVASGCSARTDSFRRG